MSTAKKRKLFLEYPNIEKFLKEAPSFSAAFVRYKAAVKALKELVEKSTKWRNFSEKEEATKLYEYLESYLERYYNSYRDIMAREKLNESENNISDNASSVITPFFKRLPVDISKEIPHITFVFSGRFKSFHSFLEKAITIIETRDEKELNTYYDLHGCKFKVSSYPCPNHNSDYESAESECYELMNTLIQHLIEKENCKPMVAKYVGPTSEKIREEFREFVKDYVANPKKNNYKALHAAFEIELNGIKHFFEVQIVSKHMESMNKKGETSHHTHKKDSKIPLEIDYTDVHYSDFEWEMTNPEAVPDDDAGIVIAKELTKKKVFRRIV